MAKTKINSKISKRLIKDMFQSLVVPPPKKPTFKNRLSNILNTKPLNKPLKSRISKLKANASPTIAVKAKPAPIQKKSSKQKNKVIQKSVKPLIKKAASAKLDKKIKKIKLNNKPIKKIETKTIQKKRIIKKENKLLNKASAIKAKSVKKSNIAKPKAKKTVQPKSLAKTKKMEAKKNVQPNIKKNNTELKKTGVKALKNAIPKTPLNNKNKKTPIKKKGKKKTAMDTKNIKILNRLKPELKPSTPVINLEEIITSSQVPETANIPVSAKINNDTKSLPKYFGFKNHPFGDSLDTSYLYKSNQHEAAFIKLLMSIEHDISFGLTFGKSGTGKTLLSQAILERLPKDRFLPILVPVTPGLSKTAFLNIILKEFGYDFKKPLRDTNTRVELLSEMILSSYKAGIKPVIMIDECHFLSSQALHILRSLSNFEAFNKKLITCLLFAEDSFLRRLSNPAYASLRNRIYLEVEISSLSEEECQDYVKYRLMISDNKDKNFFSKNELNQIWKNSKGIPRNINKECTKIMVEKYLAKK